MKVVPTWDVYFMNIALAVAARSKDPSTQVGALLINDDKDILGTGYNGFPPGVVESEARWERPEKYGYVVHAEENALLRATGNTKGAICYTTMYPCPDCAKKLAAARVKEILYLDDRYKTVLAETIFTEAGIKVTKL